MSAAASKNQEMETDVLVIGYGGAGAAAAITANDLGARVTILEKMPAGGGNTVMSAGAILVPKGMESVEYFEALCHGTAEREIIETFVRHSLENEDFLNKLGGNTERWVRQDQGLSFPPLSLPSWPDAPGAKTLAARAHVNIAPDYRYGKQLWQLLSGNVERRQIPVLTETPAKELVTDRKGQVIGAVAERQGKKILVKARKGVILTCGGFAASDAMKQAFLPCGPFYNFGYPGCTGDGILMAQKVGAALWHMTTVVAQLGFKSQEYEAAYGIKIPSDRFITVDKAGKRFANETNLKLHDMWRAVSLFDPDRRVYPHMPSFHIFDETDRKNARLNRNAGPEREHEWSEDNSKEIARGWIKRGGTIRELAGRLSVDESGLESTLARYNGFCKTGVDADFGRQKVFLAPIENPPYYGIELWPCLINTQGGPRRNKEARVVDSDGKPIPRLYSAGELGSFMGCLYEAGMGHAECFVFGRIAARNAVAEKPWK